MIEIKKQLKGTRESLKKIEEKENSYKSEKIEFDQVRFLFSLTVCVV